MDFSKDMTGFTHTLLATRYTRRMKAGALACLVSMCSMLISPVSLQAATPAYEASIIAVHAPARLAPGQTSTVSVTVKNIGSATWSKTSKNYVSIYSYDNARRTEVNSVLASPGWENAMRPARLPVATLAPGGITTFTFPLKAPSKVGTYKSDFLLVAENLRRMGNGRFTLNLDVQTQGAVSTVSAPAPTVPASDLPTGSTKWRAEVSSLSGSEWQINVEENIFVTVAMKNAGTETWKKEGGPYVSLYAVQGEKERVSAFRDKSWNGSQAARMIEKEVKPGQIGRFKVELRGPRAPGAYREEFMLAAEDAAWISGSRIILPIVVPLTGEFISQAAPGQSAAEILSQTSSARGGTYATTLLLRSLQSISLAGTTRQEVTVGFKNTGTAPWNIRGLKVRGVTPALTGKLSSVRDDSWRDLSTPVQVMGVTNPGEVGFLTFYVKTPPKKGTYQASFQLYADNQPVDGGVIDIPITVTADGYIEPEPAPKPVQTAPTPSTPSQPAPNAIPALNPIPLSGDISSLPNEPIIRAGIFATTDDKMVVKARFSPLEVRSGGSSGAVVCTLAVGQYVTVKYDRGSRLYSMTGDCAGQSSAWYVVHAQDGISPMEMSDFSRPVGWLPGANDNTFRANLELRYAPQVDQVWVINELPIEYYLRGIAETSNVSPMQYQRTLLTAARTYAMYHVQRGTKHAARNFTVDATYDQVYRGYGAEARSPTIVAAVEATRGQIVTYDGKLAITPYFSRSDGRTRDWTEVWGGAAVPWLKSVQVPHDIGKTLWGHGVGMSATGALQMDAKDGATYDQILRHFYTGTELRRAYK
ncbi:hypothetical protein M0Q28_03800 [Patescibacteria group bacterium]|jgi:hypothetical protein|nr:hypothetical protein [Patescibacteria group bacterium]